MSLLIVCISYIYEENEKKPLSSFVKEGVKRRKERKIKMGQQCNEKPVVWNVYWTLMSLCCFNSIEKKNTN